MQFTLIHKILSKFQTIKQLKKTIINIMPTFWSLMIFLFLILYMYTIVAFNLFPYLRAQSTVNAIDVHFRTFSYAM